MVGAPTVQKGSKLSEGPTRRARPESLLVTDGDQRSSLAAVRALSQAGFSVMTCSKLDTSLAGRSRFSRRSWHVSDPLVRPKRYVDEIASIVARRDVDLVLPMTEASLLALLPERSRLSPTLLPFDEYAKLTRLLDKNEVLKRARAQGIAVPNQLLLERQTSTVPRGVGDLRFPVVLKPGRSIGSTGGKRRSVGVTHVPRPSQLEQILERLSPASFPLLVQERIRGPGVGIFLLLDSEGIAARFAHRRLREKPPSGGVSVLRESILPDESLFEKSRALLADFDWEGVAMVEFKLSEETGQPYLMEINPRLWGSLQLAIDAGVDFPTLLVRSALGERVPRVTEYRVGVRTRWLWGDADHLAARLKSAMREGATLRQRLKQAAEALGAFASGWGSGTSLEVFRWDDPVPFLHESVAWWRDVLTDGGPAEAQ